ncbi:hypothetical protein ACIBKY_50885 [Nonomuraea sp. NPDC050394]|uniref:hypothetical protein n=1 Tax=Nonomuraea sp. NPDC050394 TaxID=3364363 RepID=UPI0037A4FBAD
MITPPGDVHLAYAMPLYIPPGRSCIGVSIALRGTPTTTGTFTAAVYQSASGSMLPIGITNPSDAMPIAGWHNAHFPAPIAASDELRKVMVYVSVAGVSDSHVKLYNPGPQVGPFIFNPASYISMSVGEPPAVLRLGSPGLWQSYSKYPIIALG